MPLGGPSGGSGGTGGAIWIVCMSNVSDLSHLLGRTSLLAENGLPGGSFNKAGRRGKDLEIRVPVGN